MTKNKINAIALISILALFILIVLPLLLKEKKVEEKNMEDKKVKEKAENKEKIGNWSKLLSNLDNAEGCREAMRISYENHIRGAKSGMGPRNGTPLHHIGLYGALASRYKTRGIKIDEMKIWAELTPFLLMSEKDSLEALAEYVVYQEIPNEAKINWLKKLINDALRNDPDSEDSPRILASLAIINKVSWCDLLDSEIKAKLKEEAQQIEIALKNQIE